MACRYKLAKEIRDAVYNHRKIENNSMMSISYAINLDAIFDVHTKTFVSICTLVSAGISLSCLWHANIFMLFILSLMISNK